MDVVCLRGGRVSRGQ